MSYNNKIEHHGVKGMKWGVRRTPEQLGKNQDKQKSKLDEKKSVEREKSHIKTYTKRAELTDEQLRQAVMRINLENQLHEASRKAASFTDTRTTGQKLIDEAKKTVIDEGKKYAKDAATAYVKNQLDSILSANTPKKPNPTSRSEEAEKRTAKEVKKENKAKQMSEKKSKQELKKEAKKAEKEAKDDVRKQRAYTEKVIEEAMVQGAKQLVTKYADQQLGNVVGSYDPKTGRFDWE